LRESVIISGTLFSREGRLRNQGTNLFGGSFSLI
jgi:hypothetical protein